ncbi:MULTISPECIES: bifunctional adenosylcobinamide kinase/adenosylcobinamide-phosphate guanylyltransferase [Thalassolituus]|uniref:Bifunctional adenosylcobalamin biosynthesis protein n=1 Tax=Thalassolituus oleivorans MIL-1 TaxID=1298593 RepID=M5DPS0_9GAMM|nr:bifunctional adenosylcobinamide kinase/adenosylcobinamide-phosphate guanylyltransferase [Thalassolituus oleivorans]MBQ0727821.1 bifunctional adenosylcobinamide kinase/adenosylcobinamide-phosphate guanylyltransferase [Thalassolituus oleivorans]MBQ0780404.1 bifunctional adenosylcobinamide kinase/adenosylcobinamide-phosphate guanylyltransferase [Thalassolituus oleivorans]CCU71137.1 cobalbumin biosynthesis protein [Thalassolituus oleivorans MIL-1]
MKTTQLILGGARSGKSRFAEKTATGIARRNKCSVVYVATAQAGDDEMAQRIERHRRERSDEWLCVEEPIHLSQALIAIAKQDPKAVILVDCLTLWVTNCLLDDDDIWQSEKQKLIDCLEQLAQPVVLVSNEVGQGIVPMGQLSRRFVDESGWLHQDIAAKASHVTLVVAGLPLVLK